jgi:hypothetical protein
VDVAPTPSAGRTSLLTLGFACFFFDNDLDGWPDIYVADGYIDPAIEAIQHQVHYTEPQPVRNAELREELVGLSRYERRYGCPRFQPRSVQAITFLEVFRVSIRHRRE